MTIYGDSVLVCLFLSSLHRAGVPFISHSLDMCPDHMRFLRIRISYMLIMLVFFSTAAFVIKSNHVMFRVRRSCRIIYASNSLGQALKTHRETVPGLCIQFMCSNSVQSWLHFHKRLLVEWWLWSLLFHSLSLSWPKAFKSLEVLISSTGSSLLLLLKLMLEPRYLNLEIWLW